MKNFCLPSALALAICLALNPSAASAQQPPPADPPSAAALDAINPEAASTDDQASSGDALELDTVSVTGSRIKRTEIEGVEPVQIYTSQDLQQQGFSTLYDALTNLNANTGIVVGEEVTNNFNANAQALNLRGFGAGYTLVLLNGRRMPILPKPAGSVSGNVINLAMIPYSAVERVEVLTSGASAIYGSDAVAGVVNVILKDDIDATTFSYRYGDTVNGGGRSDNFTVSSGFARGDTRASFGLEWDRRRPIRGDQRDWFDHPQKSPDPAYRELEQVVSFWDVGSGWDLLDIGDRCGALGYDAVRPGWMAAGPERYCGDNVFDTYTVRNGRDRVFGFANLTHDFAGGQVFQATLMSARSEADAGLYRYSYGVDYDVVEDIDSPNPGYYGSRHFWRSFRDFETPTSNQRFEETSHTLSLDLGGQIGSYDYSVGYTYGIYNYEDSVERFDDQTMLSMLFGTRGVDWSQPWAGSRWLQVNRSSLDANYLPTNIDYFGPLTPDMFTEALRTSVGDGRSTSQTLSADLAGTLFNVPAGPVDFATVVEANRETYRFLTDQATVDGEIYGWSGIRGEGDRNRYALGAELAIPLAGPDSPIGRLDAKVAARYDYYDDASDVSGAPTYQVGLAWRPIESLMFRASRATSFRAPDLHVMFAERSSSYASAVDYLACVQEEGLEPGMSWEACGNNYGTGSFRQYSEGDPSLREEKGYTNTVGMVAQLGDHHSLTLDWFRIHLTDQVGIINAQTVVRYAAECELGFDAQGNDVDINSPKCQEMMSRMTRGGPNGSVVSAITSPFNTGMRQQEGFDLTWLSKVPTERWGEFTFRFAHTHILETLNRYLPEDEVEDIRDEQWNTEFRTRSNATLAWVNGRFNASVHVNRLGTSPARWADGYVRLPAWTTTNVSLGYKFTDALSANFSVVNVFDKEPPSHESEAWWPYADIRKHNPAGAEYFLTLEYRL
ncbi:TonB-dependent receptor domain-containing protein [Luteimonas sp. A478]